MSGHVVITGASSGIGYSLARRLAKRGWRVSAIARRYEKLTELQQHEGSIFPFAADVSVPEQNGEDTTRERAPSMRPFNERMKAEDTKIDCRGY